MAAYRDLLHWLGTWASEVEDHKAGARSTREAVFKNYPLIQLRTSTSALPLDRSTKSPSVAASARIGTIAMVAPLFPRFHQLRATPQAHYMAVLTTAGLAYCMLPCFTLRCTTLPHSFLVSPSASIPAVTLRDHHHGLRRCRLLCLSLLYCCLATPTPRQIS